MNEVSFSGKTFEKYISAEELTKTIATLAEKIRLAYGRLEEPLVLISILDGSFVFMADLIRALNMDVEIHFVKLKSYQGTSSSGEIAHILKLQENIKGRQVLVVEDIIDTGLTLEVFLEELKKKEPLDIKVCTLLSKPEVHNDFLAIDFIGREIPPYFVIGYGLDIDGQARQLPAIYKLVV